MDNENLQFDPKIHQEIPETPEQTWVKKTVENNEERSHEAALYWNSIREKIETELKSVYEEPLLRREEDEHKEMLASYLKREENFVLKTLGEAIKMRQERGVENSVVLFDVDNTIGFAAVDMNSNTISTILRPTTLLLIEKLKSLGIEKFGLLTNRPKDALTEQLKDEKHLKAVDPFLDPTFVFSTRDIGGDCDSHEFKEDPEAVIKERLSRNDEEPIPEFFDQEKLAKRSGDFDFGLPGNVEKIFALQKFCKKELAGKNVLVIDDFTYPMYLNNKIGLYGVVLERSEDPAACFSR